MGSGSEPAPPTGIRETQGKSGEHERDEADKEESVLHALAQRHPQVEAMRHGRPLDQAPAYMSCFLDFRTKSNRL